MDRSDTPGTPGTGGAGPPDREPGRDWFQRSLAGLYRARTDGVLLDCNDAFAAIFGLASRAEAVASGVEDLRDPPPERRALLDELAERGAVSGREWRGRRRDGAGIWLLESAALVREAPGGPATIEGSIIDVSERQRAEEALRDAERRSLEIIEAAPVGIHVYRLRDDGALIFSGGNPAAERILRLDHRPLTGLTIEEAFPALAGTDIPDAYREVARTGSTWHDEQLTYEDDRVTGCFDVHAFRTSRDTMVATFTDITERRAAERDLHDSRQMLRLVLDTIPQRVFWKDRDFTYLGCNRHFARDAGVDDPSRIVGRNDFDLAWRESAARYRADDRLIMLADRPKLDFEEPQTRPDGSTVWLRTSKVPLHDPTGAVIGLLGTYEDITERKRAEQALRASEERLERALWGADLGLWDWHVQTGEVFFDQRWATMLGYSMEELEPTLASWERLVHPDDLPAVRQALEAHLRGETPAYETEHRVRTRTGAWKWILDRGRVTERDPYGRPLRATGTHLDVTQRREAEEALRSSEEKFRELVENVSDAIYVCDAQGLVTYMSPRVAQLTGHEPDDLLGHPLLELVHPADAAVAASALNGALAGQVLRVEVRMTDAGGAVRWVSLSSRRVVRNGEPAGVRGVLSDVTDRRQVEEQLRQAQKMEAVGQLAGGVAHDFNNLLQAMLSLVALAGGVETAAANARELAELDHLIRRGAQLVRQLLLFSRRESGRPEPLDLGEAVRATVTLLRRLLRENIELDLRLADEPLPLEADRTQLEQVVVNLALNAADAMPDGGRLTIATRRGRRDAVVLELTDTGHGISPEVRERIFEPFFSTKTAGAGSGLGLAVVDGIVTGHGGRVEVTSSPGRGSAFRVHLPGAPAAPAPGNGAAADLEPTPAGAGERVLLVEDEEDARKALSGVLRMLGYEVAAAGTGEEALALAGDPVPDLLLTDLVLPGIPGSELAERLTRRHPSLPVIFMSGYTDNDVSSLDTRPGDVRFLQKPFDMETLARELRAALAAR